MGNSICSHFISDKSLLSYAYYWMISPSRVPKDPGNPHKENPFIPMLEQPHAPEKCLKPHIGGAVPGLVVGTHVPIGVPAFDSHPVSDSSLLLMQILNGSSGDLVNWLPATYTGDLV